MRKVTILLALVAVACFATDALARGSDHGCDGCHIMHTSGDPGNPAAYGVPLWDNTKLEDGLQDYDLYTGSKKFKALVLAGKIVQAPQPDGPTRLCLGCHDGSGYKGLFADKDAMTRSHPMSFVYDTALFTATGGDDGTLYDPMVKLSGLPGGGTIDADLLDDQHKVQCISCHDTHKTGFRVGDPLGDNTKYMRFADTDDLCVTCHNK